MYDIGKLYRARTALEAAELLKLHPSAVIIAGGSDVLIKIREGRLAGCELVSIQEAQELRGVSLSDDGDILIGPLTSFTDAEESEIVNERIQVLAHAAAQVGGPQIRNIGTIGGNICNGVTSADTASTLLALGAVLTVTSAEGQRDILIEDWYKGVGKVALETGELLTRITIPRAGYEGKFGHYIKYSQRNAMDIATLGCAALVKLSGDKKTLDELRLAYGVASPVPIRCFDTEVGARGRKLDGELLEYCAKAAVAEVNPRTSWRASKEFRLHLIQELARRAIAQAVAFAGGYIL